MKKKPKLDVDKKKYFITHGKTFSQFVKYVEATKNDQSDKENNDRNEFVQDKIRKTSIRAIREELDRTNSWGKLK